MASQLSVFINAEDNAFEYHVVLYSKGDYV
jgi:hypothetical protein